MGAKVQCNGYLPAYYHMKDLNDDVRSTICSQFYEDRIFRGGQYCNGFMQQSPDGYSEDDKEVLKQTMLKHEAIFRKQVSELHRLYRVQKDLMDDLKRNKSSTYSLQLEAVSDGHHLLQIKSADSSRIWHASMPSVISSNSSRQFVSDIKRTCSPLDLLKENGIQTVPTPTHSIKQEVCEPFNLQRNKSSRRSFDLQLPADEYIDIEDEELSVEEVKVPDRDVVPEVEVKLTLGTGYSANVRSGHKKSGMYSANGFHGHQILGSNNTCEEPCRKGIATSSFRVPGVFPGEVQARELAVYPSPVGPLKDCVLEDSNRHYWNFLESECKGTGSGWNSSNLASEHYKSAGAPFSQIFRNDERVDFKKSHESPALVLPEQRQKELWLEDTEMLKMNVAVINTTRDIRPTSLPGTSAVAQSDPTNSRSLEISSWRSKNTSHQLSFGIQSQAHSNGPTRRDLPSKTTFQPFQSTEFQEEKLYLGGASRPKQGLIHEVPHCNGIGLSKPEVSGSRSCSFLGLEKPNLNTEKSFTYGHPEDNGPRKIMKEFDYPDVKASKSVALSLGLTDRSGDDSCLQNARGLFFPKGKDDDPLQRHFMSQMEVKAQANTTANVTNGSAQTSKGLSRVFHQPLSYINLEEPSNVKYETARQICVAAEVSLPENAAGFVQEISFLQANKNDLAVVPEIQETRGLSSSGLNFLKGPFACKLPSEASKDWSKFEDSKKQDHIQELQESTLGDKFQSVENHVLVGLASGCSALQEITGTASGSHDGLRDSGHEFSLSLKMESLAKAREVSKQDKVGQGECKMVTTARDEIPKRRRRVPQNRRIDLSEVERNGGENDWIDLGLPVDSARLQTPVVPTQMAQKVLHLEETFKTDCSVVGDKFRRGDRDCSTESADALISLAAEVLMIISAVAKKKSDCVASNEPGATSDDPLEWFADVACSNVAAQPEASVAVSGGKVDDRPQSSDGDFFETMTLMLRDTKMDEDYCYKPPPQDEELKGPETDASPGPNQPSRRTSRRGRRQRDFLREILPGLMSLSRHEVTEDMQTFGGLMRASGCFWQTGLARKFGCKNGWGSPSKGRRSRGMAVEANEAVRAVLQSTCNAEVDENGGLKGFSWGKTTRRRRRMQRSRNTSAPASCVTKK